VHARLAASLPPRRARTLPERKRCHGEPRGLLCLFVSSLSSRRFGFRGIRFRPPACVA
jgi:hypothetical protein